MRMAWKDWKDTNQESDVRCLQTEYKNIVSLFIYLFIFLAIAIVKISCVTFDNVQGEVFDEHVPPSEVVRLSISPVDNFEFVKLGCQIYHGHGYDFGLPLERQCRGETEKKCSTIVFH